MLQKIYQRKSPIPIACTQERKMTSRQKIQWQVMLLNLRIPVRYMKLMKIKIKFDNEANSNKADFSYKLQIFKFQGAMAENKQKKGRKFRTVLPKGKPVKNLLKFKSCYHPACGCSQRDSPLKAVKEPLLADNR